MAAILWQVPRQMFAAVRAAIYIVAKHRHANICKRTVSQKWPTTQTDGIKRCGRLVPELCFILKKREKKSFIILQRKKPGIRSTKSGVVSERILPSFPNCVQKCKRNDLACASESQGFFMSCTAKSKDAQNSSPSAAEENFSNILRRDSPL